MNGSEGKPIHAELRLRAQLSCSARRMINGKTEREECRRSAVGLYMYVENVDERLGIYRRAQAVSLHDTS